MNARQWRQLRRRSLRVARSAIEALRAAGQRLAERLAYRPREVVVVALLAAGLFGGLAVERWRNHHPALADRLEAEPARPSTTVSAAADRGRARAACRLAASSRLRPSPPGSRIAPRLDLNRATPGELARVAGISWRLAARIVAARDAFEGGERAGAFAGRGTCRGRHRAGRGRERRGFTRHRSRSREPVSAPLLPLALAFALGVALGLAVDAPAWLGPLGLAAASALLLIGRGPLAGRRERRACSCSAPWPAGRGSPCRIRSRRSVARAPVPPCSRDSSAARRTSRARGPGSRSCCSAWDPTPGDRPPARSPCPSTGPLRLSRPAITCASRARCARWSRSGIPGWRCPALARRATSPRHAPRIWRRSHPPRSRGGSGRGSGSTRSSADTCPRCPARSSRASSSESGASSHPR
jgi:hypothetical protein